MICNNRGYIVDYILFMKADVDLDPNFNEVRDYKYVTADELKAMFEDPSKLFSKKGEGRMLKTCIL